MRSRGRGLTRASITSPNHVGYTPALEIAPGVHEGRTIGAFDGDGVEIGGKALAQGGEQVMVQATSVRQQLTGFHVREHLFQ